jgi:hypothetical protein
MPTNYPAFLYEGPFPGGACRKDFETLPTIDDYEFDYIVLPETAGDEGLAEAMRWAWRLEGFMLAGNQSAMGSFQLIPASTTLIPQLKPAYELITYPVGLPSSEYFDPAISWDPSTVGTSRVVSGQMMNSLITGTQASPSPPARACALIREFPVLWRASMSFNGTGGIQETYDCWVFLHYHTGTSRWRIYYSFNFNFNAGSPSWYFLQNPAIAPPASSIYFDSVTNSVGMVFDIYESDDSGRDPIVSIEGAPEPFFWF